MEQFLSHNVVLIMIAILVNLVGRWGKILVIAMGFVDHLGQSLQKLTFFKGLKQTMISQIRNQGAD